jgi:PAS domain S-box-containing protein
MGERMRARDWSATPLGPVEGWSQSLRTMTSILLANRFPMLLWWGPESISIYNDAYVPVLGVKHPGALGQPVRECWSEIWDVLRPLVLTPLNGGPPTWSEDLELEIRRHGFLEETHWTVAYSPVPDETAPNGIGGVLATVHETTAQVVGDRRSALLRELGARSAAATTAEGACAAAAEAFARHAKDVPFALVYLVDPGGRTARLAGAAGVEGGGVASPLLVDLTEESERAAWPLARALRTGAAELVEDLGSRPAGLPQGLRSDLPQRALVVPVESSLPNRPAAVLVLGLSPLLELDVSYRGFVDLAAAQLASAIAHARAYEAERTRAETLAQLDRAKTLFFTNVSHELRTPLTLMLGPVADALRDDTDPPSPGQRERLETVQRNARRLLKLVNSLLDFSRIEAGRMEASYEPTDVGTLTAEIASAFRSLTEGAGLKLEIECSPLAEPVFVDRQMWEKIVLNLVSNAFKFTFEGAIHVRVEGDERCLRLAVRDTGTGIEEEHLPHLFERFYRVEGARGRTYEGTGIGLALVRELVRMHGGSVSVQSEPGKGTTFVVSIPRGSEHLPRERIRAPRPLASATSAAAYVDEAAGWVGAESLLEPADAVGPEPDDAAGAGHSGGREPAHILVADDNADMRAYLARLLRPLGTVETVADGRQALAAAARRPPDLVVSDVMMPNLDGFGLVSALRRDERTKTTPTILLSARAGEDARVEGLSAGTDDYMVKPFAARELVARVRSQLQLARVRNEHAEALRLSEEKIATVFAQSAAAMSIVRAEDGRYVEVNDTWLAMLGFRREEVVGRTPLELGLWPDHGLPKAMDAALASRGAVEGLELDMRTRSGDARRVLVSARLVEVAGERVILGSAVDITARNQAEQALRQREARLELLSYTAGRLLGAEDPRAVVADLCGKVIEHLDGDAFLAYLLDDEVGTLRLAACDGIPEGEARAIEPLEGDPRSASAALGNETAAAKLMRSHGVRAFCFRPLLGDGRVVGGLWFGARARDSFAPDEVDLVRTVADQVAAAVERLLGRRALSEANSRLVEADRRKNEFLATLSHELRNPLEPITNSLFVLDHAAPGGEQASRARQIIARQAAQLSSLVNDLLDVTRISRNKIQLQWERLDLDELVRRTVEDCRSLFERAGVHLAVVTPVRAVHVRADRTRIAQVVGNLLHNAAKFTPAGGRARVSVDVVDGQAVVGVADDGVGMTPVTLARLFEPFMQATQSLDRSKGGLGLGLALVKSLVEQHGGSVHARSEGPGGGAEFTIRLPVDVGEPAAVATVSAAPREARRRVLLVEDNADAAFSLREVLELGRHEVEVARDGPGALEKARAFRPDVVLCDIGLPGMDGYDVARAFRSDPQLEGTPLVALTGYALPEDLERAAAAGFERHLAKPPDPQKLAALLGELPRPSSSGGPARPAGD